MPHPVCQTRGTRTTVKVRAAEAGLECAVTDCSQLRAPANAASWFHRWFAVQTPSGKKARKEPIRASRKFRAMVRSEGATARSGWSVVRGSAMAGGCLARPRRSRKLGRLHSLAIDRLELAEHLARNPVGVEDPDVEVADRLAPRTGVELTDADASRVGDAGKLEEAGRPAAHDCDGDLGVDRGSILKRLADEARPDHVGWEPEEDGVEIFGGRLEVGGVGSDLRPEVRGVGHCDHRLLV